MQSEAGIDTFDFAETTASYSNGPDPSMVLKESLLMDAPGTKVEDREMLRGELNKGGIPIEDYFVKPWRCF